MGASTDVTVAIESALLEGGNIAGVLEVKVEDIDGALLVCARVDIASETSMREVSTILYQAKRRIEQVAPAAKAIFLEPDVWVDPNAVEPTTSAIVTPGYN